MNSKQYSIIIPAFNESKRIQKTLIEVSDYFKKRKIQIEIFVIDDGSTDNTGEVIEEFKKKNNLENLRLVKLSKNSGKGFAVKTGVFESTGENILFLDADGSTPIEEFEKMEKEIVVADIAIGSRFKNELIKKQQPFYRRLVGLIGKQITKIIIRDVGDTQCGFKLFRANIAKDIFKKITVHRFGFDMEVLVIAKKKGYKIIEIPVEWSHADGGSLNPLIDSIKTFFEVLKIRINLFKGLY